MVGIRLLKASSRDLHFTKRRDRFRLIGSLKVSAQTLLQDVASQWKSTASMLMHVTIVAILLLPRLKEPCLHKYAISGTD